MHTLVAICLVTGRCMRIVRAAIRGKMPSSAELCLTIRWEQNPRPYQRLTAQLHRHNHRGAGAANVGARFIHEAGRGLAHGAGEGGASGTLATHASLMCGHEMGRKCVQRLVGLTGKSWPVRRVRTAGTTGLAVQIGRFSRIDAPSRLTRMKQLDVCFAGDHLCFSNHILPAMVIRCAETVGSISALSNCKSPKSRNWSMVAVDANLTLMGRSLKRSDFL